MVDIETGAGTTTWATTTFSLEDVIMATIKNGTSVTETPCTTNGDTGMLALIGTLTTIICTCIAAIQGRTKCSGSTQVSNLKSKEVSVTGVTDDFTNTTENI